MKYIRRFLHTFHVSLMPRGVTGHYLWLGADDYGDFVIWVGRVWVAASWSDRHPWKGDLA